MGFGIEKIDRVACGTSQEDGKVRRWEGEKLWQVIMGIGQSA
jgi:hypothetical protein